MRKAVGIALSVLVGVSFLAFGQFEYQTGLNDAVGSAPSVVPSLQSNFVFHDFVNVLVFHQGALVYNQTFPNLITNAGEDVISRQTACAATGAPACANGGVYIALTTDTVAPAATDTTLTSEQTLNGLARALGTYTHTGGANTHQIKNTFTYTGSTSVVIAKVGLFDASSAGNMMAETLLASTATVSANGDQIVITWTLTH